MQKKRLLSTTLLALLFIVSATAASAQKGTIRGNVLDAVTAEALPGTTIIIEGTTLGTVTDAEGGFTISNITPGRVVITAQYLGYEVFREGVDVTAGSTTAMRIPLNAEGIDIGDVVVVAQIDNENENVLLSGQREALAAIQSVGAAEMSRKGIGNAQAAVAQVSGISKQDGVKNVFVRGLGDRYNATFFNGFPLPSEDPEYKNIALEFFGSDIIQAIGVNKVFTAGNNGDVGGAVIDISSKELVGNEAFSASLDGGVNTAAVGAKNFLKPDGVNYLGVSRGGRPTEGRFDFPNSLDPSTVKLPLNHSYGLSGGKRWLFGENQNPLSFFVVGSQSTDYSFTEGVVRNATPDGSTQSDGAETILLDQTGKKSSIGINQLVLGNAKFRLNRRYSFTYNFLMIHASDQYVGDYQGYDREKNQATGNHEVFVRRQQSNDNMLLTHQILSQISLSDRWEVNVGAAYNTIAGLEPDRREIMLPHNDEGKYTVGRQNRFFSKLDETDLNLKASVSYKLKEGLDMAKSNITLGYRGRIVDDGFRATEYYLEGVSESISLDDIRLDNIYNASNFDTGQFTIRKGNKENRYDVTRKIHSVYIEATHQFTEELAASVGFQADKVDMTVDYDVDVRSNPGAESIDKLWYLPSFNIKYDITEHHSLRLGASKSYTLPQSKEIAPYQYVNIGFTSEGNENLKPSDNYNVDLKWDWYPSSSELVSLGVFYKYISNPIGRVDVGGSARMLSYNNIAKKADVAGVEFEMRKNLFNTTTIRQNMRRLSVGLNASYIYSDLEFTVNTSPRSTGLEGASPFLVNGDISYNWSSGVKVFNLSIIAGWFSDRIYTLGTTDYKDTMEEGVVTLSAVSSFRFNKFFTLKLKVGNLLDPAYRLTREFATEPGGLTLNEYRKGIDVSLGVSFDLW